MIHRRKMKPAARGIGMTSQGTRDRLVNRLRDHGIRDERVLKAIATTPRHEFVDEALSSRAYEDTALPIGLGQTISQPWVVAKMTEALLDGGSPEKVLEVGTGSGYQAAVLAALVPRVFTVERIDQLLKLARRQGWPEKAPFDGIIVTAAATHLPMELVLQLKVGGVLVAPVEQGRMQRLLAIRRTEEGHEETDLGGVIFVPLLAGLS